MKTDYKTIKVTFKKNIEEVNKMFTKPKNGEKYVNKTENGYEPVTTMQEWIEYYDTSRYTQINDNTVIITSKINAELIYMWLKEYGNVKSIEII